MNVDSMNKFLSLGDKSDRKEYHAYVIVVTQARVHYLICTHDAWGCAAPKGKCRHIRQCMSACVATNLLYFWHSKNLLELIANQSAYLYNKG